MVDFEFPKQFYNVLWTEGGRNNLHWLFQERPLRGNVVNKIYTFHFFHSFQNTFEFSCPFHPNALFEYAVRILMKTIRWGSMFMERQRGFSSEKCLYFELLLHSPHAPIISSSFNKCSKDKIYGNFFLFQRNLDA